MLRFLLLLSLALPAAAQTSDEVRAVVVLARHGVRAPIENETRSSAFNALPWPAWPVSPGTLTPHGVDALKRMGEFYRQRYSALLAGGCGSVSVDSTNTSRTIASAKATLSAVAPGCAIDVRTTLQQDPPTLDRARLADAIGGRMANQPAWFEHAFAAPLAEMHGVLTACNAGDKACAANKPDFRTTMLEAATAPTMSQPGAAHSNARLVPRDSRKESAVALGADFAENFLLQYVEGLPIAQVGWGRVPRPTLDRLMEMNTRYHDFILRTPYYAQLGGGPLAQLILKDLGDTTPRFYFLSAHDAQLTWLGGLLRIDWLVSDETFNATPPGSALVFELHHNRQTNADTVQAFFVAQTLDQIRNLTPLTGGERPSISPIYIPNCSGPAPTYACTLKDFAAVVADATKPQ